MMEAERRAAMAAQLSEWGLQEDDEEELEEEEENSSWKKTTRRLNATDDEVARRLPDPSARSPSDPNGFGGIEASMRAMAAKRRAASATGLSPVRSPSCAGCPAIAPSRAEGRPARGRRVARRTWCATRAEGRRWSAAALGALADGDGGTGDGDGDGEGEGEPEDDVLASVIQAEAEENAVDWGWSGVSALDPEALLADREPGKGGGGGGARTPRAEHAASVLAAAVGGGADAGGRAPPLR